MCQVINLHLLITSGDIIIDGWTYWIVRELVQKLECCKKTPFIVSFLEKKIAERDSLVFLVRRVFVPFRLDTFHRPVGLLRQHPTEQES
jgi:hypothetical protein